MAVQERPRSRGAEPEQRVRQGGGGRVTGEAARAPNLNYLVYLRQGAGLPPGAAGSLRRSGGQSAPVAGVHLPGRSAEDRPAAVFLSGTAGAALASLASFHEVLLPPSG